MPASPKPDFYLISGLVFAALNLLHMLLWAAGWYLPLGLHLLVVAICLGLALQQARLNALLVLGLLIVCVTITLLHPVSEWDARSIWLFHAKRIYLDGSLFGYLDEYAHWSHNDYPPLVPAMSASIARSIGYWNEIAPRAAVAIALAPPLFLAAFVFRSWAQFCLWIALLLYACGPGLLTGYMDCLIAINFATGLIGLAEIYRLRAGNEAQAPWGAGLMLGASLAQLLFLKNEGAALASLLTVALLPAAFRRPALLTTVGLPWLLFFLLWKLPMMQAGLVNDLATDGGLVARGWERLMSFQEYGKILYFFKVLALWSFVAVALMLALIAGRPRRWAYLLPSLLALSGYVVIVFVVYLTTYQDLAWHLKTSADRVLLAFEFGVATLLFYLGCRLADLLPSGWALRSDSGV
jgi:hypothetical protein